MQIIQLKAENIKNLKVVEITPGGKAVVPTGKNGAGKSAVLDSIFTALTGKKLDEPIRKGEERAEINIDMGEFSVKKVFTEKGTRLEVTSKDGDVKKSPQTFLDDLFGKITFDPLAFTHMRPTDQIDLLKDIVGLDFSDIAAEQKFVYDERTGITVQIRGLLSQLKGATPPDPDTPEEEVSFKEQIGRVNKSREKRDAYNHAVEIQRGLGRDLANIRSEAASVQAEIKRLEQRLLDLAKNEAAAMQAVNDWRLPPEVSEAALQEEQIKLSEIEGLNVKVRLAKRYNTLVKESNRAQEQADKLTQKLERLEQDKATRIANAKFPIPGLSMNDDAVMFDGIPFSQLSTGQQIRVSTAIAMALNPQAKIILIREGSLLDKDGMEEIVGLAGRQKYQIWIEKVDDSGQVGIYIEDGSIKAVDGKEID